MTCPSCTKTFEPRRRDQMFCSTACRDAGAYQAKLDAAGKVRKHRKHLDWPPIIEQAAQIVEEYMVDNDGLRPTLRKLFYKLVAVQVIPKDLSAFGRLGTLTAEGRQADPPAFPDLSDDTREISREGGWDSPDEAREWLQRIYRRNRRDATQPYNLYIANEKIGMKPLLEQWFEARGIAVVCLGGNAPTRLIKSLRAEIAADFRETVILYAGDYDASGFAIFERLKMRVPGPTYIHVGLTKAQVRQNRLPKAPGKEKVAASEKKAFIKANGEYVQVEIDPLDEDVLKGLYETARAPYWDDDAYQDLLEQESAEREELA